MQLIRLLHARHFDPRRRKFTSLAFKNSSGGGVSVIDAGCAGGNRLSLCEHIAAFYPERVTGKPAIFWKFGTDILPAGWTLEQQTTITGDVCHHNLVGLSDRTLRSMLNDRSLSDFVTCAADGARETTTTDVEAAQAT